MIFNIQRSFPAWLHSLKLTELAMENVDGIYQEM